MRHLFTFCTILIVMLLLAFAAGGQTPPLKSQPSPEPSQQVQQPTGVISPASLPNNPAPKPSSPARDQVRELPRGERIKISYGRGPVERCRFAGATDSILFCDPYDAPLGANTYRIDLNSVTKVKVDHDQRNGALIFAAFIAAGGTWAGLRIARSSNDGAAIFGGFLGAGLGALAGYPVACLTSACPPVSLPPPPRPYAFEFNLPINGFMRRGPSRFMH